MNNSKSILIVGNFLSGSMGTTGICEALALRLEGAGWQVLTTSGRVNRIARLLDMIITTWAKRRHYVIAQVDVYSGPSFFWAEAVTWLLHWLGKPYVLTLHGGNLPRFAQRWPGRVQPLLNGATEVTTPSHYLQEALRTYRENIIVLPNALDLSLYPSRMRPAPQPRVAWLRAFHEIYAPAVAVEAASLLKEGFPEITLTMFGPDKHDGSLERVKEVARNSGMADSLIIPGAIPKSEVPTALSQSDIFLNTTTVESFGVSVMEAAALGMCIVTTNVGELPYIWTHDHDALLVPPNDPEAMADAVRRILTEPGLAERLSRNARAKAEQFDWSIVLPQWEQLLISTTAKYET